MTTATRSPRTADRTEPGGPPGPRTTSSTSTLAAAPTVFGALAVLGGTTALMPLVAGVSWLLPVAEVVTVVWLVGIGARLLRLRPWIVELLQLAALAVALTSLFTTTGIGGVLPGPAAASEAATMLGSAWDQIMTSVPPATATAELGLFIALAVGAVALVVDLLIAGAKTPALVALPLLGLYAVPASIYSGMLPWYAFVLPAACYAALLALSGHRGVRAQSHAAVSLGVSTAVIGAIAIAASVVIAGSATGIGTNGRIPHTSHSGGPIGLSPWALLRGQLTDGRPEDVLNVTGVSQPAYLRTFTLEKWTDDKGFGFGPVSADVPDFDGTVPGAATGDDSTVVTITPQSFRDKYLPLYPDATAVSGIGSGWNYDKSLQTVFRTDPTVPGPYTVTISPTTTTAAELRQENVQSGGPLTQTGTLPSQVTSLANSITAGTTNPFDAVDALLHYFTDPANGFTYSLSTPLGNSGNALVDFLTNKKGYCEQYAAAMAIMVRSLGIPARVGVGFTQGVRQADGSYEITSNDAHAWVEVKFDKSGWVMFDPTPLVDGQGGLQGFVPAPSGGAGAGGATGTTTPTASSSGTAAPTTTHSLIGALPHQGQKIPEADTSPATSSATGPLGGHLPAVLIAIAGMTLFVLLLAAPTMFRRARRRKRLALAAGHRFGAGTAAWQEIRDTLIDHGIGPGDEESVRATANRLARVAHLPATGREQLKVVISCAEQEWYGAGAVGPQSPQPDLAPGVQTVITALDRTQPRRWPDRVWPRSLRGRR